MTKPRANPAVHLQVLSGRDAAQERRFDREFWRAAGVLPGERRLIVTKRLSGRPQDLRDVELLSDE